MSGRVPETSKREAHEPSGFARLLAAEVALEAALVEAEREAEALLRAADQEVCEVARRLPAAIEAALAERAADIERSTAAECARIRGEAERRVAAWDAVDGAALAPLVAHVVARVVGREALAPRGAP